MSSVLDKRLRECIHDSLQILRKFRNDIVPSSMPILFFGDLECYKVSNTPKVITLGLNPSRGEFPKGNRFERFPLMRGWNQHRFDYERYVRSLCHYFHGNYYHRYFDDLEYVLHGVGSSFVRSDTGNIALHTDICPLATRRLWRDLPHTKKSALKEEGKPLWEKLMEHLEPQLIVASVGLQHLSELEEMRELEPIHIRKNYKLKIFEKKFNGRISHIVNGEPLMGRPFGNLSRNYRERVGKVIRNRLRGSLSPSG